jgi:hypothetical protein
LDPATKLVPFGASIDIRDTVDYKVCYNAYVNINHVPYECVEWLISIQPFLWGQNIIVA